MESIAVEHLPVKHASDKTADLSVPVSRPETPFETIRRLAKPHGVVAYHPEYTALLGGDADAGLFLSQAVWLQDNVARGEWFYHRCASWEAETGLGRRAQARCRSVVVAAGWMREEERPTADGSQMFYSVSPDLPRYGDSISYYPAFALVTGKVAITRGGQRREYPNIAGGLALSQRIYWEERGGVGYQWASSMTEFGMDWMEEKGFNPHKSLARQAGEIGLNKETYRRADELICDRFENVFEICDYKVARIDTDKVIAALVAIDEPASGARLKVSLASPQSIPTPDSDAEVTRLKVDQAPAQSIPIPRLKVDQGSPQSIPTKRLLRDSKKEIQKETRSADADIRHLPDSLSDSERHKELQAGTPEPEHATVTPFSASEFSTWVQEVKENWEAETEADNETMWRAMKVLEKRWSEQEVEQFAKVLWEEICELRWGAVGDYYESNTIAEELFDRLTEAGYCMTGNVYGSDLLITGGHPMDAATLALIEEHETHLTGLADQDAGDLTAEQEAECRSRWDLTTTKFDDLYTHHRPGAPIRFIANVHPNVDHQLHLRGLTHYPGTAADTEPEDDQINDAGPIAEPAALWEAGIIIEPPDDEIGIIETEIELRRTGT